ncbi:hypothetical protein M422DRAFT_276635 [Sphaerobolus stellatus SS14]|uniref:Uncharacterized protein n=1 Tax=Sphaerobolus stellatus (strain SS14) TaxID=990650 RepID=A0A0C9UCU7_SPHS4|nr:hypothetical protein M422DRAFT_276635 [Sphaerobolus stellatus SS14]
MPSQFLGSVRVHENKAYLFNGRLMVYVFNLENETWETMNTTVLKKQTLVQFRGGADDGTLQKKYKVSLNGTYCYELDFSTRVWRKLSGTVEYSPDSAWPSRPDARRFMTTWVDEKKENIHVFGGESTLGRRIIDMMPYHTYNFHASHLYYEFWRWNIPKGCWYKDRILSNPPLDRLGMAVTFNKKLGKELRFDIDGGSFEEVDLEEARNAPSANMKWQLYFSCGKLGTWKKCGDRMDVPKGPKSNNHFINPMIPQSHRGKIGSSLIYSGFIVPVRNAIPQCTLAFVVPDDLPTTITITDPDERKRLLQELQPSLKYSIGMKTSALIKTVTPSRELPTALDPWSGFSPNYLPPVLRFGFPLSFDVTIGVCFTIVCYWKAAAPRTPSLRPLNSKTVLLKLLQFYGFRKSLDGIYRLEMRGAVNHIG